LKFMEMYLCFYILPASDGSQQWLPSQTVDKALREIMFLGAFFYHYKDVWV